MNPDPGLTHAAAEAGLRIVNWAAAGEHDVPSKLGSLRLVEWRGPEHPVVLFLHGGGQTSRSWELVARSLSSDARCVAFDLPGHGESEWVEDGIYRSTVIADAVAEGLRAVDLDPDVVVGASLGGLVGVCLATKTRSIRALAMLDVGPESLGRGIEGIRRFLKRASGKSTLEEYVSEAQRFNPRRSAETLRSSLMSNLRRAEDGSLTWKYDPRVFEPLDPSALAEEKAALWAATARLDFPVLVMRAGASAILTRAEAAALATRIATAEGVEISDAGHTIHGDQPAAVVWALGTFMERHLGLGRKWRSVGGVSGRSGNSRINDVRTAR